MIISAARRERGSNIFHSRGVLAAQRFRPQAVTLAEARGLRCVEVDLAVLRGEREPALTLFA